MVKGNHRLLTKENESICVVNQLHSHCYLVYRLERREKYAFQFYGITHTFVIAINQNLPLSEQPFGLIGSSIDLSGRKMSSR